MQLQNTVDAIAEQYIPLQNNRRNCKTIYATTKQ